MTGEKIQQQRCRGRGCVVRIRRLYVAYYGIDEARFTKPVYPGATIGVKLTVKEKIAQEKRSEEDVAKGIVKWLIDVYDETGETVAIATILTMVKKRNQD